MSKIGMSQVLTGAPANYTPIDSRWLQYFILLSAPLLTVIDVFIVNISIPSIKKSLEASDAQVQLIIASYLLGYASFMITGGRAGDFWGRKKVFMWGMLAFIVTSCFCGIAENANVLIAARFLQGISGAFMTPQALSYLQVLFPDKKERTNAIGYLGITLGTASTLGQFLGGYFSSIETFIDGWRMIFFINLPIGLIALWASRKYLAEIKIAAKGKFDVIGVILIIVALATLIYPLTEGRELGWPWWSFALITLSFVFFYLFVFTQKRKMKQQLEPLIDLRLFQIRSFNKGLLAAATYFMVHTSYLLISTIYIQNGLHIEPFQTGLLFVAFGVSFMISSFLSIRLVNRFGKLPVQMGLVLMIICYLIQLNLFDEYATNQLLCIVLFITGFAGGFVLPSLINLTLSEVPKEFTGAASGVYNTVQQAASSIGICLVGGIFFYTFFAKGTYVIAFHTAVYGEIVLLILVLILITSTSGSRAEQKMNLGN
jgi:EmrB/QacA subfamily drug resistance transporter